jgi:predicted alpha/beta hydrolase family esterase
MSLAALHRAIDRFAIWTEDRLDRPPAPCRLAPPRPLECFGPLGALPDGPSTPGSWRAPTPSRLGDRMRIDVTPARGARRGTVLLAPPWKIARPGLVGGYVRLLARMGQEVWVVCPPHHLDRAPPGTRSGEAFVSLELTELRRSFEAFVVELRAAAAMAARRGPVGLVGLSLGALAGAFAATAPERLEFAALVAPAHLGLVLAESGVGRRYRRLAVASGEPWPDRAALDAALAPFDPASRPPTAARLLVAAALHDRVVPAQAQLALARAWGVPPNVYRRGHLSLLFLCRALRRDLARFVAPGDREPAHTPRVDPATAG